MMKLLLFIMYLFFLIFNKKNFWMVYIYLMLLMFYLMVSMNIYSFSSMISYSFSVDSISFMFVYLSVWILILMFLASNKIYENNEYLILFLFNLVLLLLLLLLSFLSMSLMKFYLFFEGSLVPTLLLILGWGYQSERIQAGMYMLFYTLIMSMPMLFGIMYIYEKFKVLDFYMLSFMNMNLNLLYFSLIMAFLVKMPMFLIHLWLPKAHVEAPISGSMILAGVLLKLGGYGLIRVMSFLIELNLLYNYLWISISVIGMILISLNCIRQVDLKSLIAYSSVAHMSMVLCGMMTMSFYGMIGSINLMIAHGLCSSGMFCLANFSYERLGSRSLFINKGLINLMPKMSLWWFFMCSMNLAIPPSLNLLAEIMLMNSMIMWSWLMLIYLFFYSFFCGVYNMYLYSYSQHGKFYSGIYSFSVGSLREYYLMFLHWIPLNLLMFKMMILMYLNSL
nr:NADH dehydrogenase subunit 4 [Phthiridium sp. A GC-2023a]